MPVSTVYVLTFLTVIVISLTFGFDAFFLGVESFSVLAVGIRAT
jgi:hypothetical protein